MDNLILSTLFFNTVGLAVIVLGLALASCLPGRHRIRPWVKVDEAKPRAV
jgi:hypothetical protein